MRMMPVSLEGIVSMYRCTVPDYKSTTATTCIQGKLLCHVGSSGSDPTRRSTHTTAPQIGCMGPGGARGGRRHRREKRSGPCLVWESPVVDLPRQSLPARFQNGSKDNDECTMVTIPPGRSLVQVQNHLAFLLSLSMICNWQTTSRLAAVVRLLFASLERSLLVLDCW